MMCSIFFWLSDRIEKKTLDKSNYFDLSAKVQVIERPDNSNNFLDPLEVQVIGSVLYVKSYPGWRKENLI